MKLVRTDYLESGIFGELEIKPNEGKLATLEHAYPEEHGLWLPKIPEGSYKCVRSDHRLHGMDHDFHTFEITNVPGHSNILFHPGNTENDSEGCILLGSFRTGGMIFKSKDAFERFMTELVGINEFTLEILRGDLSPGEST